MFRQCHLVKNCFSIIPLKGCLKELIKGSIIYESLVAGSGSAGEGSVLIEPLTKELSEPTPQPWYIRWYLSQSLQWPRRESDGQDSGIWISEEALCPMQFLAEARLIFLLLCFSRCGVGMASFVPGAWASRSCFWGLCSGEL